MSKSHIFEIKTASNLHLGTPVHANYIQVIINAQEQTIITIKITKEPALTCPD